MASTETAVRPEAATTAGQEPVLAVQDLRKIYRTETVETSALAGVSLRVERGDYVALIGASGSGKTTLMSILGLLDTPSSGEYLLAGTSVTGISERARARVRNARIGFIFQSFNLIGDLSVWENVELPLVYRGGLSSAQRRERARAMLAAVGIDHREKHLPSQLSGGQQQRVAVARALVSEPEIILADEPTGNLDSQSGEAVMGLLEKANREMGATIFMSTHDMHHAQRAKRVIRMADGHIIDEYSTDAPEAAPRHLHPEDDHAGDTA